MRKNLFRIIISTVLVVSLVFTGLPVYANNLSQEESKKKELESSLKEANALVASLKDSKASVEEKIASIDSQIANIEAQSNEVNAQITDIEAEIKDIEEAISKTRNDVETKQQDMAKRIVYSYENGRINFLNALFTSKDMTQFLNIIQYSLELAKYDTEVMEEYEQTIHALSTQTDALLAKQETALDLRNQQKEQLSAISALRGAKENELVGIDGELIDASAIAAVYEKEVAAQNEVLSAIRKAIEAEKAAAAAAKAAAEKAAAEKAALEAAQKAEQQAQAGANAGSSQQETAKPEEKQEEVTITPSENASGFIWPCPSSKRITSDFGMRESPTEGASTNHKGIDIGAAKGSSIIAAQAGKVILSQYSASAGNYIIISHGVNSAGKVICSVYMHADTRLVEVGDTVSRGQQIATVGSTGYSTGPHLHFGVTEDGVYVNPWGYVSK